MPEAEREPDPPVTDADSDADAMSQLADDVPAATARRKRLTRQAAGRPVKRSRKPRCPACGYFFNAIESWTCPRCQADLREVGFTTATSVTQRFGALLRAIARRLRRRPRTGMACGRCEYPARGIGGFDCPECGSDLRQAGILDRDRISRAAAMGLAVTLWSLALVAATLLLSDWLSTWAIPQHMSRASSFHLITDGLTANLRGTGMATRWRGEAAPLRIMAVTLQSQNRFVALRLDFESDTYSSAYGITTDFVGKGDRDGDEGSGISGVVLVGALRRIGLDPNDTKVQAQARELTDAVFAVREDRFDPAAVKRFIVSGGTQTKMQPSASHRVLIPLYWLAIWLATSAGLAWLLWRRLPCTRT